MTIRELIDQLSDCNPDAVCRVYHDGELLTITEVDNTFSEDDSRVDINVVGE